MNGTRPWELFVRAASDLGAATATYFVVADYGWAERILCSGCCRHDANDIAGSIAAGLLLPADRVHLAGEPK